jgi:putative endonuclease
VTSHRARSGRNAEFAVADYLVAHGFAILARNVRVGALEIDLVARKGELAIAVEVRTRGRGAYEKPLESVTPAKRARIAQAVERYWHTHLSKIGDVRRMRIDVAAVSFEGGKTRVEYVEGAISSQGNG